jgi:hypothetical protein
MRARPPACLPCRPQEQILSELRYQSSLDLNEDTYNLVRRLPLATELVKASRQQLVMRLDEYCERSRELFEQVRVRRRGARAAGAPLRVLQVQVHAAGARCSC